jgi:hypothetical protein
MVEGVWVGEMEAWRLVNSLYCAWLTWWHMVQLYVIVVRGGIVYKGIVDDE